MKRDHAEAVRWYRKAAEQGQADAQHNLGAMHGNGKGVKQSPAEAARLYRKAAEQGHAGTQYNLGVAYANGRGVEQDHTTAVRWYRKAAEQGDADAQQNLGVMYENGEAVKRDHTEAVLWFQKAADQGPVSSTVAALKQLFVSAVTSNAMPKAKAPATGRMCSNFGIGEGGGGAALMPCSRHKAALYCGREGQVQHREVGGHKAAYQA